VDQNKSAAFLSRPDNDFLDFQVLADPEVTPPLGQHLFVNLLIVSQLLPQDVLTAGPLKDQPVLFRVHPPVHHPDAAGELPAHQVALDLFHGCHIRGVARKGPALDGDAFLRHGQSNDDLGKVLPVILGMAIPPQSVFMIFLVPLEVGAGGVEKDQIHFQVQQVRHGKIDFFMDDLPVFQQNIHGPVQMLKLDRLGVPQDNVILHPFLNAPLGVRGQGAIGYHGKGRPLHRRGKRPFFQTILQNGMHPQHLPQRPQKIGAAHRNAMHKLQRRFTMDGPLNLMGVLRGEKAADAFGQSFQGVCIQGIRSAEGVQNLGFGASGRLIPDVMGKLDVGHGGTVFVLSRDRSNIHAYLNSMYHQHCQVYYDQVVCLGTFQLSENSMSRFQ